LGSARVRVVNNRRRRRRRHWAAKTHEHRLIIVFFFLFLGLAAAAVVACGLWCLACGVWHQQNTRTSWVLKPGGIMWRNEVLFSHLTSSLLF